MFCNKISNCCWCCCCCYCCGYCCFTYTSNVNEIIFKIITIIFFFFHHFTADKIYIPKSQLNTNIKLMLFLIFCSEINRNTKKTGEKNFYKCIIYASNNKFSNGLAFILYIADLQLLLYMWHITKKKAKYCKNTMRRKWILFFLHFFIIYYVLIFTIIIISLS